MGTGISNASHGVPGNPRVEFAASRSKKENRVFVMKVFVYEINIKVIFVRVIKCVLVAICSLVGLFCYLGHLFYSHIIIDTQQCCTFKL